MGDVVGKKQMTMMDINVGDVMTVYEGPVGQLWEMLMGEEIHVGGEEETRILAEMAGVGEQSRVLDVLAGQGGPARHLARRYGATVMGLDITPRMVAKAVERTRIAGLGYRVTFRLGNALDMPFRAGTFDIVWGQDSWCYVTDKERLLKECRRVAKPGGTIAFTDWIQTGTMSAEEWQTLNTFMVFPYMETLEGYTELLQRNGFTVTEREDLSEDFSKQMRRYHASLTGELEGEIVDLFGKEVYRDAERGLALWRKAADEGKVGRGRFIGRKT